MIPGGGVVILDFSPPWENPVHMPVVTRVRPDAGHPAGLSCMPCRIWPEMRHFFAGYPNIWLENPAMPDIRPNPSFNLDLKF